MDKLRLDWLPYIFLSLLHGLRSINKKKRKITLVSSLAATIIIKKLKQNKYRAYQSNNFYTF